MPFFEGLDERALHDVSGQMRRRRFEPREVIVRQGDQGDSLFVIQEGAAQVTVEQGGEARPLARLRRGDVVGEMSLVTGERRSASVVASVPTQVLELGRDEFALVLARHPTLLVNLSRILSRRLARASQSRRRGEAVALLSGAAAAGLVPDVIEAARRSSPGAVASLSVGENAGPGVSNLAQALAGLDDLLASHASVVLSGPLGAHSLRLLLDHVDRMVLVLTAEESAAAAALVSPVRDRVDVVLVTSEKGPVSLEGLRVTGRVDPRAAGPGVARLGRVLARTRLGLALGAGGAKGYAHVGVLQVLEEAGYAVDCVGGSSIGAMVGAWVALGRTAAEIEATLRSRFSPENVAEMFTLTWAGTSAGAELHRRLCRETTGDLGFADLEVPFVAMAVDLNTRQPAPVREGPVWEALVASTALAGLYPPFARGGQRLVDGLALVPVPTTAVAETGADVMVSVNLMSRETLAAWPSGAVPAPAGPRRTTGTLDTLLEVMDLAQLDASVRHAALADVVVTPRFGPSTWRDFHLADLFLAAGREAARAQLPALQALARPQPARASQP
jgi:predicted acylesterase/phospholipase RssA/CRP-like cAMP-binding protein